MGSTTTSSPTDMLTGARRAEVDQIFDIARRRNLETQARQTQGLSEQFQQRGLGGSGIWGKAATGLQARWADILGEAERERAIRHAMIEGQRQAAAASAWGGGSYRINPSRTRYGGSAGAPGPSVYWGQGGESPGPAAFSGYTDYTRRRLTPEEQAWEENVGGFMSLQ